MDSSQHTATALDELRRIEAQAQQSKSLAELRYLFDRVQALRRAFPDHFEFQLAVADVQEQLIEQGRRLRGPTASRGAPDGFEHEPRAETHPTPPGVEPIDPRNWTRAIAVGIFFAVILFAAFFYLIQTARRLNIEETESRNNAQKAKPAAAAPQPQNNKASPLAPAPTTPTLRLYTDLVPGTVTIDQDAPRDLQDGELELSNLAPGDHSIHVTGRGADSSFTYTVQAKAAPVLKGQPAVNNVLLVLVSGEGGKATVMTSAPPADLLVDGKPAGTVAGNGLVVNDLGTTDHTLELTRGKDTQRFVLTYTQAPVLTAYLKADPNAGTLVVEADQDGAELLVNDRPYRRRTEHGALRLPALKVGDYMIRLRKDGFEDTPPQMIHIRKGEELRAVFHLKLASNQLAGLQVMGAQPGTAVLVDKKQVGLATAGNGNVVVTNIKPGPHLIELQAGDAVAKSFQRNFVAGQQIVLSGPDTQLEKAAPPPKSAKQEPPPPAEPLPATPAATGNPASANAAPAPSPAEAGATSMEMPGATVRRGGGFVSYHAATTPGRYSFAAQLRKGGGFLKKGKLQWFAGYQNPKNYLLFQVDGKRLSIRQVIDGKAMELKKASIDVDPSEWVQVEMSVAENSITTRLRAPGGPWQSVGTVTSDQGDFSQGRVGLLIPGNDEVAVANFRFVGHE